jgi:hypothetical protein
MSHPIYDIIEERKAQDKEHGGPAHDNTHPPKDWIAIAGDHYGRAAAAPHAGARATYRQQMVRLGAISLAALETFDRVSPLPPEGSDASAG